MSARNPLRCSAGGARLSDANCHGAVELADGELALARELRDDCVHERRWGSLLLAFLGGLAARAGTVIVVINDKIVISLPQRASGVKRGQASKRACARMLWRVGRQGCEQRG